MKAPKDDAFEAALQGHQGLSDAERDCLRAARVDQLKWRRQAKWSRAGVWAVLAFHVYLLASRVYEGAGWFKIALATFQVVVFCLVLSAIYWLKNRYR